MNCWKILEIEPIADKSIIKQAYVEKLNLFHPEEDPEGFQNLREAYETALKECEKLGQTQVDNSPIGLWIQRVEEIYNSFSKRINPVYWEELLEDDICFQIDSANEVSNRLLKFLMDKFRIPHKIWIILNEKFYWDDKQEELYNNFPSPFIDFVMSEIKYEDGIDYELFEGEDDSDYDLWFKLYYELKETLNEYNKDKALELLTQLKALGIKHFEMTILEIRCLLQFKKVEEAKVLGESLIETYPEDPSTLYAMAQIEYEENDFEAALKNYKKAYELNPNHMGALVGMGDCSLELKSYEDAQKYYQDARSVLPYNTYIRERLYKTTEGLIENYKIKANEEPENLENIFNLCWAYYDTNQYDEAKELIQKLTTIDDDYKSQYYDLQGRIYSELGDYDKSLKCFYEWLDAAKDENEKSYIYVQIAIQYQHSNNYYEALNYCNKALEIHPDFIDILNRKSNILNKLNRYEEAIEVCNRGIEIDDSIAHLYLNKAEALYNLGDYNNALDNCDKTNEIYPYFTNTYLIQIKIYFYVNELEQAMDIINKVEELQISNGEIKLIKARILNRLKKYEESEKLYNELLEEEPENDLISYNLAYLYSDMNEYDKCLESINKSIKLDDRPFKYYLRAFAYRKKGRLNNSLKDYNYIIENEPDSDKAYEGRGIVYVDLKEYDKAIKDYKKAIDLNPKSSTAYDNLGEVYELKDMYEEAADCYTKQLEIEEDDYYYISRGWCYIHLEKYNEALKDFNSAFEINPNNVYAYNGIGNVYKYQHKYDKAIEAFKPILDLDSDYRYVYRSLAQCYEELGNYDEAINCYTQAIEKYNDDESFYLDRGLIYSDINEYDKALADYKKALEINPDYSYAYNNMGVVYRDLKEYEKAASSYKKAIEKKHDNYKAIGNLAHIYLNYLKKYKEAAELYTKQLKFIDNDPDIYSGLGEAYFELGKQDECQKNYKIALEYYLDQLSSDEDLACAYENIGMCYERLNSISEAIKYYNKAIECASECNTCTFKQCHEAYYRLGKIQQSLSNENEALKYYKKALEIKPDDSEYQEAIEKLTSKNKGKKFDKILKTLFKKTK